MNESYQLLRQTSLGTQLPDATLRELAVIARIQSYSAGAIVQLEGDPAQALFLVVAGLVKIMRTSAAGREQVLHLAGVGQHVNLVPMFDGGPCPASVQALTDARLLALPKEALLRQVAGDPALALVLLADLSARQRMLVNLVDDLALHTVQGRLARLLLTQAEAAARGEEAPPLTQADMAARLGTVREMVGRALKTFEGLGLISLERGSILIRDQPGLEAEAER
ncbi:MAG TPA: Crp/Fnr family transcriptional regulator [Roseiflexaceae bacterium]|nr:Crp/Fnr family transcriptional regulator [Roseiflexaceae bacterium]HMP42791.1 Crp/Fnr family transcriptional regulator [Roseiflexaceae bacterium]